VKQQRLIEGVERELEDATELRSETAVELSDVDLGEVVVVASGMTPVAICSSSSTWRDRSRRPRVRRGTSEIQRSSTAA
jgi:hypothetical protein